MLRRRHGEDFWSAQVRQAADLTAKSDADGLERFLKLLGRHGDPHVKFL